MTVPLPRQERSAWELAGSMSDTTLARLLDDLQAVPLLPEPLIEAYADGRWLHEPSCQRCGTPVDRRRRGCTVCVNRHEKRRQRNGREPAPLNEPWKTHGPKPSPVTAEPRTIGC